MWVSHRAQAVDKQDTDQLKAIIRLHCKIRQDQRTDVGCFGRAWECGWIVKVCSRIGSCDKAVALWQKPPEVWPTDPE